MAPSEKIKFKVGIKSRARTFADAEELLRHLDDILAFWGFLTSPPRNHNDLRDLSDWYNRTSTRYGRINNDIRAEARSLQDGAVSEGLLRQVELMQTHFDNLYSPEMAFHLFTPKSQEYHFIVQMKAVSEDSAFSALRHILIGQVPDAAGVAYGVSEAVSFLEHKTAYEKSFEDTLGDLQSDFEHKTKSVVNEADGDFQKALSEFRGHVESVERTLNSCEKDRKRSKGHMDTLREIYLNGLRDRKKKNTEFETEFNRITETYTKQMQLEAPASYWSTKKWAHIKLSGLFSSWIITVRSCSWSTCPQPLSRCLRVL